MSENDLFGDLGGGGAERPPNPPDQPKALVPAAVAAKSAARPVGTPGEAGYSASDIEVLEGLEPVRRRPGMYIGGTDEKALHHLFAEVIEAWADENVPREKTVDAVNLVLSIHNAEPR
jgi:topoisomerase-4 subunit B